MLTFTSSAVCSEMPPYLTLGPNDTTGDQWGAGMDRATLNILGGFLFWSCVDSEAQIELQIKNLKH